MTPEQEIRAVAIKAAASFCAPISGVADQQIPNLEDVLFVADVFYGYVQDGWPEALRIHATSGKQEPPSVRNVELREQKSVEDVHLPEPAQAPGDTAPAVEPPITMGGSEEDEMPIADIIPIEARGVTTKAQSTARRAVDRIRRQRAEQIFKQAQVAKTEEHKQRLLDETEQAGLLDFPIKAGGREQELGQYLASL